MTISIIDETDLALDRYDGNIFIITMRKAPENRLNSSYCQKLIRTRNLVRTTLGQDSREPSLQEVTMLNFGAQ